MPHLLHLQTSQQLAAEKGGAMRNTLSSLLVVLLTAYATANAATHTATSWATLQSTLDAATEDGAIVFLDFATTSATSAVIWNAPPNATLKGRGTTATGGGDQTVIIDDSAIGRPILSINVSATGVFRMTGITFQSGTGALKYPLMGLTGPGKVRVDHCRWNITSVNNQQSLGLYRGVFGVMDNCILDFAAGGGAIYMQNGRCGTGEVQGNLEWSLPTNFGGEDYFFIEDNIVNGGAITGQNNYGTRLYDGYSGGKVVVRFNTLNKCSLGETHGTGHAFDDRGLRSQEAYGNLITSDAAKEPLFAAVALYSGTALVWGNSWDNVFKNMFRFQVVRRDSSTYNQSPPPVGWGYAGTAFNGNGSAWDGNIDAATGYPALDQPGRGQGDLLTGGFPSKVNSRTGTVAWPNQALEPIYIWNNTGGVVRGWGDNYFSDGSGGRVLANRDYYPSASGVQTSPTSPFNGTSGVGWGTLANRPTTCTPGVAYWATDQGSWNKSTSNTYGVQMNGADGVLYKCTAPNTWTRYYEPYTYPHPFRMAPQNVRLQITRELAQ